MLLWDLTDLTHPHLVGEPLQGYGGYVQAATLLPTGHVLVTASTDAMVVLWDLSAVDALRADVEHRVCSIGGGGLTPAEWAVYLPGLSFKPSCGT